MLQSTESLIGFSIRATDGLIGKVKDFYFDDQTWEIHYLVIETGSWLFGRKVLIAPKAGKASYGKDNTLIMNMTKEQIRTSPDVETDRPVSKQMEAQLYDHYSWPYYGSSRRDQASEEEESDQRCNPHLRSFRHVSDYKVYNKEGFIGDIADFYVNTEDWTLPFLLVRTLEIRSDEKTVVPSQRISVINFDTYSVYIDMNMESLSKSLKLDASGFMSRSDQKKLST